MTTKRGEREHIVHQTIGRRTLSVQDGSRLFLSGFIVKTQISSEQITILKRFTSCTRATQWYIDGPLAVGCNKLVSGTPRPTRKSCRRCIQRHAPPLRFEYAREPNFQNRRIVLTSRDSDSHDAGQFPFACLLVAPGPQHAVAEEYL